MLTPIAQFVRNRLLARSYTSRPSRLTARVLLHVERLLAKAGDPLVRHRIGGHVLALPLSHALPRFMGYFPHYNRNLGRIGAAVAAKYPDLCAIDVGANVGDSVAIFRERATFPILCVEADVRFYQLLEQNARQFGDVALARAYLGESDHWVAGRLDVHGGTANLQPAAGAAAEGGEGVRVTTLDDLLASHPAFAAAKLLKLDTDGYDNKILRGGAAYLGRARPVVFFEYDPHFLSLQGDDGVSIFPFLRSLGYANILVYENTGPLAGTVALADDAALADLHRRMSGHGGQRYVDLCAFHGDDVDLFDSLRRSEAAVTAAPAGGAA